MKKMKALSILLFVVSVAVFIAYGFYEKSTSDTKKPVIQCDTEELVVSVNATEEELLQGVTATDDKLGDVSDALVVESISAFTEENTRIITYAVIDAKGNVGRCQRTLIYEDYHRPKFSLTDPLRFPMGKKIDILERVSADSLLDGNLKDKIKCALDNTISLESTGVYSVEYSVMDSGGSIEYLPVEIEVYDPVEERIKVTLSQYLVYVPLHAAFDPNSYFVGSDIDGTLTIQSGVNTAVEGVYYVDYLVTGLNGIGKSRLIVVVES